MNLNDANRINDAAPVDFDCIISMHVIGFGYIMELTKEEKRELLQMWKERLSSGS